MYTIIDNVYFSSDKSKAYSILNFINNTHLKNATFYTLLITPEARLRYQLLLSSQFSIIMLDMNTIKYLLNITFPNIFMKRIKFKRVSWNAIALNGEIQLY